MEVEGGAGAACEWVGVVSAEFEEGVLADVEEQLEFLVVWSSDGHHWLVFRDVVFPAGTLELAEFDGVALCACGGVVVHVPVDGYLEGTVGLAYFVEGVLCGGECRRPLFVREGAV